MNEMTRLILTTSDSGAGCLKVAEIADKVIGIGYRFSAGPLLSEAELAKSFASFASFSLADVGDRFDAIELWIDPDPNAQLILIWLLQCSARTIDRFETEFGAGGCPDRGTDARASARASVAGCQDRGQSPRTRKLGLAGLAGAEAAGLAWSSFEGFRRATAASAGCGRSAR